MKWKAVIVVLTAMFTTLIFWPWYGSPFDYVRLSDRFRTSIPIALIFGFPCQSETEYGGIVIDVSPNCYRFDEPREYSGLWLYQFEGSNFYEGLSYVPPKRPDPETAAWLSYHPEELGLNIESESDDQDQNCNQISAIQIRFVGRERQGSAGHFGQWNSGIWPEKIIQAKPVPAPDCNSY